MTGPPDSGNGQGEVVDLLIGEALLGGQPGIVTDYVCAYAYVGDDGVSRWGIAATGNDLTVQGLLAMLAEDGRQKLTARVQEMDDG